MRPPLLLWVLATHYQELPLCMVPFLAGLHNCIWREAVSSPASHASPDAAHFVVSPRRAPRAMQPPAVLG